MEEKETQIILSPFRAASSKISKEVSVGTYKVFCQWKLTKFYTELLPKWNEFFKLCDK